MRALIRPVLTAALLLGPGAALAYDGAAQAVLDKIESARACKIHSECVPIEIYKCPFGCDVVVHRKQKSKIIDLLKKTPEQCEMTCPKRAGSWAGRCVARRCVLQRLDAPKVDTRAAAKARSLLERIYRMRPRVAHRPDLTQALLLMERRVSGTGEATDSDLRYISKLELDFPAPKKSR